MNLNTKCMLVNNKLVRQCVQNTHINNLGKNTNNSTFHSHCFMNRKLTDFWCFSHTFGPLNGPSSAQIKHPSSQAGGGG